MDKGLVGQVGHSRGHLSTVTQEGVVINDAASMLLEIVPQVSLKQ